MNTKTKTHRSLDSIVVDLSRLLSELSANPAFQNRKALKLPFPPNQIRRLATLSQRWDFLEAADSRSIGCCMQLCDVFRWQLNFWRIDLTAGNMFNLYAFIAVSSAIEHISLRYAHKCGLSPKKIFFNDGLLHLRRNAIINEDLYKRLDKLKNERNNIHLERLGHVSPDLNQFGKHYNMGCNLLAELETVIRKDASERFTIVTS